MNRSSWQSPVVGSLVHGRLKLVEVVPLPPRRFLCGAVQSLARLEVDLHGSQRDSGVRLDQQGRRQVVADVRLVGELKQVALAIGVALVVQLAPIMGDQDKLALAAPAAISTKLSEWLDKFLKRNPVILQETPQVLTGRSRFLDVHRAVRPGVGPCGSLHMRLNLCAILCLQAFFQRNLNPIRQSISNRSICVDTNALWGGQSRR